MKRVRVMLSSAAASAAALTLAACGSNSASQPAGAAGSTTTMASTSMAPSATPTALPPSTGVTPSMSMSGSAMPSMTTSTKATASAHNAADITFATDMISHHRQAVTMADMALSGASTEAVKSLAAKIKAAQSPEIAEMSSWLTSWGAKVPQPGMASGMAGMSMPGMMTDSEMNQLSTAKGAAFDKLWLQMMISHHNGAISMAKTELADGSSPQAKKLASSISTSQAAEVVTMTKLLAG
jgi:uncharacterized protein (DUF305 family)